ncbi:glycosyltransferase [Paenibacillus sp. GCM10027628]|uniref:glycosyltransferase n=1 Tax=Paenibacillus sp. GCM10027628 TaxID=3273413 RepID=UPI003628525F
MQPRVSIIIPFYNCPYIEHAILSALNQTYPNIEIIVVDDGSTMHTDKIAPFLSRVHYLGKANGGTASALNCGIRSASGAYIAWLSSDDMFYPDKIECQLNFMLAHNSSISYTAFDEIDAHNHVTNRKAGARFPSQAQFIRSLINLDPINGCTVMMKKKKLSRIGLFNESLRYTHDYDLWIRFVLGNVYVHFLDQPLTMYRWHEEMGTRKHWPAIQQEIAYVQGLYKVRLEAYA